MGVKVVGKPSAPTPPDPTKTAQAQTASNVDTALASSRLAAVNQNSPYGSVSYSSSPSDVNVGGQNIPSYTQNVSLSPTQQSLYDKTTGIEGQALDTARSGLGGAANVLGSPLSLSGGPALQSSINTANVPQLPGVNDFSADRNKVVAAQLSRFNQDFPQLQEAALSRANAEGIQRGSEGYDNVQKQLDRQQVDAASQAELAGGAEQSRLFGLGAQANQQQFAQNQAQYGAGNQARQQYLNELQLSRNQPINELTALLGTSQIQTPSGAPNFGVQVQPTNTAGIINSGYQNQLGQYQANLAASPWAGLGNLAGTLGGAAIKAGMFA
jgi:hypothetical protein